MPLEDEFPEATTAIAFFRSQGLPEVVIRRALERHRAPAGGPTPSRGTLQDLLAPIGRLHTRAERFTESIRAPVGRALRETLEEITGAGEQLTQGLSDVIQAVREGRDPSALLSGVAEVGTAPLRLAGAPFTGFLINPAGRLVGPGLRALSRSLLGEENIESLSRLGEATGVGRTAEEFARFGVGLATIPLGRMLGEFSARTPRGPSVVEEPPGLQPPSVEDLPPPPQPPPPPRALRSAPFEATPEGEVIPPGLTFEEGLARILSQEFEVSETEAGAVAEAQRMGRPPLVQEPPAAPPSPPDPQIGKLVSRRKGHLYRSFSYTRDAVSGGARYASTGPFDYPDVYALEFRPTRPSQRLGHHPETRITEIDPTQVTRVFYDPTNWIPEVRYRNLSRDLPELRRMFPQAELVEVVPHADNPDLGMVVVRRTSAPGLPSFEAFKEAPSPRRGGRPRTRVGVPNLSDDEARIFAMAGLRRSGVSAVTAQDLVSKMEPLQMRSFAAEEVRQARIDAGEITGKRGAPKGQVAKVIQRSPEMMAQIADLDPETADVVPRGIVADVVSKDLKRREVRFTEEPPQLRPAIGLTEFRRLADVKGYDLKIIGPGNYELIGSGGEVHSHTELGTATEFLMKLPDATKEPIEIKTPVIEPRVHARMVRRRSKVSQEAAEQVPVPEASTFDKIVRGLPLNKDDINNLQKQKLVVDKQLSDVGPLGDIEEAVSVEKPDTTATAKIGLDEGKLAGSVEDLRTRGDVARVLRRVHAADMRTHVLRTPTGFEVVYYKAMTPEIRAAINFHSRVLNEGPRAVSDDAHRLMGRVFGIADDQVESFIDTLHGRRGDPDVGDVHTIPPPTEPRDPREGFPRPLPEIPAEGRFVLPVTQPAHSKSVLIRTFQQDIDEANASLLSRLTGAGQVRQKLVDAGMDDATQRRIIQWEQGQLKNDALSPKELEAGEASRSLKVDIARRSGTPEDIYYATHVTDFNTLYHGIRDAVLSADSLNQIDPQLQLRFASEKDFSKWKRVFSRHSRWETIPRLQREAIKRDLLNFNEMTDWEALPRFVREKLPKEIFVPYLLARRANVPYIENALKAFDAYVPRMLRKIEFDPIIEKWQPVIDSLPRLGPERGPESAFERGFSEKGYLERQMSTQVFRRLGSEEQFLQWAYNHVNNVVGREILTVARTQAAATLTRGAFIRGALGLDTAFREMNRVVLTLTQGGSSRTMRHLFRHAEVWKTSREYRGLMGDFYKISRDQFTSDAAFERALKMDEFVNKIVLAPEAAVEFFNRGLASAVGLAEAESRGLSPLMGLANAGARASEVLPNLQISDALRYALFEFEPRTQFYGSAAQRPPIFGGPFGRLGTVLTRYPSGLAGFHIQGLRESGSAIKTAILDQGFREGFADAFHQGEVGKATRFLISLGLVVALPGILSRYTGINMRRFIGVQHAWSDLSFPFFTQVRNGFAAVMGQNPIYGDRAKREFKEFMLMMAIPQRRYAKKVGEVIGNLERGYAVDKRSRYLYDATPMGEFLKLVGMGPEEDYDVRQAARQKLEFTYRYHNDKREAIDAMLDGDAGPAQDFFEKYNIPLKQEDLARAARDRQTTSLERSERGLPRSLRTPVFGRPTQ